MSHIWIPKVKIIEPKSAVGIAPQMAGWFKMEATNAYTGRKRVLADWFPNVITDWGLNRIGNTNWSSTISNRCYVGTGNATPSTSDTALAALVATTGTTTFGDATAQGSAPYYGAYTKTYRFAQGAAAGNLAEVGVGENGQSLWSRALILDSEGDPTTITVLDDEFLDVTYQLRQKPPLTDIESTINISGTEYDYVLRAAQVTNSVQWGEPSFGGGCPTLSNGTSVLDGTLGAITSSPSGNASLMESCSNHSYVNGSLQRSFTLTWGLNNGNLVNGISAASIRLGGGSFGGMGAMQISFSPDIVKNNTQILTLDFTHIWARGTP
jgi:hypothetical protein